MKQPPPLPESHGRSILKALTWRIIATLTTGIIAYSVTGEVITAVTIGGLELVIKLVFYYLHERMWQLMPHGTVRRLFQPESKNSPKQKR